MSYIRICIRVYDIHSIRWHQLWKALRGAFALSWEQQRRIYYICLRCAFSPFSGSLVVCTLALCNNGSSHTSKVSWQAAAVHASVHAGVPCRACRRVVRVFALLWFCGSVYSCSLHHARTHKYTLVCTCTRAHTHHKHSRTSISVGMRSELPAHTPTREEQRHTLLHQVRQQPPLLFEIGVQVFFVKKQKKFLFKKIS